MQGFNKYYPPDFDPRQTQTLNDYRGVHALGKRAKDVDKGILVVRWVKCTFRFDQEAVRMMENPTPRAYAHLK